MNIIKYILLSVIFLITIPFARPAFGQEASLSDIVITNTKENLLIYFSVKDCFTPELNKAIENGINTTFTFIIKLYEVKEFWPDRKIADLEISHKIKYDPLKKLYEVKLQEQNNKAVTIKDYGEAKKLMSDITALKITPIGTLSKGTRYQIKIMAELDKIKLPLYLDYVLFFLSLWDFETDWYRIDFKY